MIERKSWDEFRGSGLLWFINSILHVFGWAIVIDVQNSVVTDAYPARVKFRGFSEDVQSEGYRKVSNYLEGNISEIAKEARED